jgi:S-formylglutathione hydrolase FrmB
MSKAVRATWIVFTSVLILAASLPALAQGRIDCNALNSRVLGSSIHYCVLLPPGYDAAASKRYPVLYFLHGLGEDEQALFKTGGWNVVEDLRQKHEIGDFLIVTPEAKASFYVNSADGRVRYSDFFLKEFIPAIEAKYRIRSERRARAISGISMGGYGAFRFAFTHPELFSAVSAQSAALMTESPAELDAAMRSGSQLGRLMGPAFGNPIDPSQWRNNSPFVLARRNKAAIAKLSIYFNCGKNDDFGFENGALALHKQLDAEGIKHEFHLYEGNHGMEYFLAHLDEVMKLHSRQFAAAR